MCSCVPVYTAADKRGGVGVGGWVGVWVCVCWGGGRGKRGGIQTICFTSQLKHVVGTPWKCLIEKGERMCTVLVNGLED